MEKMKQKYLEKMAELYPTIAEASTEIINLQSILNLPKGTEHFITDICIEKWFRFYSKKN